MATSTRYTKDQVSIVIMQEDVKSIKEDVKDIKGKMEAEYVSQTEFKPIKNLVYGLVGLILTGVVSALLALVVRG